MNTFSIKELRLKEKKELIDLFKEKKKDLQTQRFHGIKSEVKNPHHASQLRREIARIKTVLTEKEETTK